MKKLSLSGICILACLLTCSSLFAQNVGVGTNTPASSAQLDVSSGTKGFLMPRMTTAQRDDIANPVTGLQIFNLDNQCTDIYDGAHWIETCGLKVTGTFTDPVHLTSDSWIRKADFGGTGRLSAVGFSIGTKGYVGTGYDGDLPNDFWQYDPATNIWTQKANFGGAGRYHAVGFSIGSKGYIGTGAGYGPNFADFWEYDPATNIWTSKANFGGGKRTEAVGFSIGNKGYIGTGYDALIDNDFWQYDPATNIWTQEANFGGPARYAAVGFSIGSLGYIGTGYDGANKNDLWQYDPAGNTWTAKTSLNTAGGGGLAGAVGFSIGSKGYIGTGGGANFWEFDPVTNAWTTKADYPGLGVLQTTGFSIGNKGYIGMGSGYAKDFYEYMGSNITGYTYSSNTVSTTNNTVSDGAWTLANGTVSNANTGNIGIGTASPAATAQLEINSTAKGFLMPRMTTAQRDAIAGPATGLQIFNLDDQCTDIYDGAHWIETCGLKVTGNVTDPNHPTVNSWTAKTNFGGTARYGAVGFSIGSKGYVGTGNDGAFKKDLWQYDQTTNAWAQEADFGGTARYGAVGFSIGSFGYIGTGYDGGYKNDLWQYDPAGNTWTAKTNFGGTARLQAVGFSIGNKGYIGTGQGAGGSVNDFWRYDQATDTWQQKTNFGGPARYGAAGFSIGSTGYIGTGLDNIYDNDFWAYDTTANAWTQKTNFGGSGRWYAVGFSMSGKGYMGTGNASGTDQNDFWQYDPAANTWTQEANFSGAARSTAVAFSIGNKGYIGTGLTGATYDKDFYEYMASNVIGNAYSTDINTTTNTVNDGAWILANGTVSNANSGNIGIGTATPAAKLDVTGSLKITNGTQGAGKVLTSDATGITSWKNAGAAAFANISSTGAISGGTGFSSVVRNSVGDYTLTLSTIPTSGATPVVTFSDASGWGFIGAHYVSAGTIHVSVRNNASALQDANFQIVVYTY